MFVLKMISILCFQFHFTLGIFSESRKSMNQCLNQMILSVFMSRLKRYQFTNTEFRKVSSDFISLEAQNVEKNLLLSYKFFVWLFFFIKKCIFLSK